MTMYLDDVLDGDVFKLNGLKYIKTSRRIGGKIGCKYRSDIGVLDEEKAYKDQFLEGYDLKEFEVQYDWVYFEPTLIIQG